MSQNSQSITNEQVLLINILNGMYNDNLNQINNLTDTIYSLNESNRQIRSLLVQILNNNTNSNNTINNTNNTTNSINNRRNNNFRYNSRNTYRNTYRNAFNDNSSINYNTSSQSGLGRIYLNNRPYIIDNYREYTIPYNSSNRSNRSDGIRSNISDILQNFFQPVEIFPTQSQIESATRIARYSDIVTPVNRSCPISLENFDDNEMVSVIRFCGHIFNSEQLNRWFRSNCRCPVCRYDIRRYNSNASTEFFSPSDYPEPSRTIPSTPSTPTPATTPIPIATPNAPSLSSTLPLPNTQHSILNDYENNSFLPTEERNNQQPSSGRTNALLFFDTILDSFSANDIGLRDFENIGSIINDISGNNTTNLLFNLLSGINNNRNN